MTLQEMLNSQMDLASISAAARRGLTWWLDELANLLPPALRDRFSSRPRIWIEPRADGAWRTWKDSRLFEGAAPSKDGSAKIGLLAPPHVVLLREVPVPRMPVADVRRMLMLDIDRLSPLAPELIHFDIEIAARSEDDDEETQRVLLGVIRRDEAARLLAEAIRGGHEPAAMAVRLEEGHGAPRFDFLPEVLKDAGEARGGAARRYWFAAVAALILLNIAVLVGRDIVDTNRVQAMVDAQQPAVNAVMRLRRRVEDENTRRLALLARGARGEPLKMLDVLTQALPKDVWVQHLEWNGDTLHIVGFKQQDVDMAAAIKGSGLFANPRMLAEPTAGPTPVRPFDVTADARRGAHS